MSDNKPTLIIRPATAMDSVNTVRLIKAGWAETPVKEIAELDEQQLLEYVTTTLRHAFVIVADLGGRLLGTLALAPIRMPWCKTVVMAEAWFAVVPQYRARQVPEKLLSVTDRFLDEQRLVGMFGTQMLTPGELNGPFEKRNAYQLARHTFVRMPSSAASPKEQAKKAVVA